MALATASNWTWNFLIAFFTPFITQEIDFRYGYVFAATNVVGGLIVYFFCMEGQGRTLEEIDTMYVQHVNPRKSAKWVAPAPEEIARIRREAGTGEGDDSSETNTTATGPIGTRDGMRGSKPTNEHTEHV